MNEKLLAHHTKLFNWFELDKISKDDSAIDTKIYMTPIKANEVNAWRSEVNKVYHRKPKSAGQSQNPRVHHSAPQERNIDTQISIRVKSAPSKPKLVLNKYSELTLEDRLNNISLHYKDERTQTSARLSETTKPSTNTYPDDTTSQDANFSDSGSFESEELPEKETLKPYKPLISMRSDSNKLLNYLTVDDCRVAARYKPRYDINYISTYEEDNKTESTDTMTPNSLWSEETIELPMKMSTGSAFTTLSSLQEQDRLFRALLRKKQKLEEVKSSSYHRLINNLENKHKLPLHDKINLELDTNRKLGSHFYRKINSALHKKIDALVQARKQKFEDLKVKV